MSPYKYAAYPEAKVVDVNGKDVQHLLWGDWVRITKDLGHGNYEVFARGEVGYMNAADLQEERLLELVFVDVGQGDGCLVITPEDKHILIDAGPADNMYRYLHWRYEGFKQYWQFESAIITHPDKDHYQGFSRLFNHDKIGFSTVYQNGIMEDSTKRGLYGLRKIDDRWYVAELIHTKEDLARFLDRSSRWHTEKGNPKLFPKLMASLQGQDTRVEMLSTAHRGKGFLEGYDETKDLRIQVLSPVVENVAGRKALRAFGRDPGDTSFDKGKTKNGQSIVLMLQYRDLRVLLGGDLNRSSEAYLLRHYSGMKDVRYPYSPCEENDLVDGTKTVFRADIAKSCHHGSADVTNAMLRAIGAVATVVSSGDSESHAHPRPDTLGAIGAYGRGRRPLIFSTELLRSTRERPVAGKRNVEVYGAIQVRTDGRRAIVGYKLEKKTERRGRLTKWDIYRLEQSQGAWAYRE